MTNINQVFYTSSTWLKKITLKEWLFLILLIGGTTFALSQFGALMDVYEKSVLILFVPTLFILSHAWQALRTLSLVIAGVSLYAIYLYGGTTEMVNQTFWLKYMLSSQSATLWMGVLFWLSTLFYIIGFISRAQLYAQLGSKLCWAAVSLGLISLLVRWYESYLLGADIGHIPISNLYEVFILFSIITALFYLYYESHYKTRQLGSFVLLIISCAVGFLFWYTLTRDASGITALVPALQSWWMKIHVPANFIGYGTFALAAMVAIAYLFASNGYFVDRLPSLAVLDDLMYKAISIGFAFFTVATILGALWAAEAWGGYWSWDPKETWALIVWLNYAAWLHMRLMKGLRGRIAAWWALVGLLVTTFAFIGVNIFLSGLHSYGTL